MNIWEILQVLQKRKRRRALCLLGQNSRSAAGPAREAAQRPGAPARARFKPDGRGPGIIERERGDGEERLTGGARPSSLTPRQRVGELTSVDARHGEVGRGYGWTQRRVAIRVEVVAVTGVAWFAGDEVLQRRSFGWWSFRSTPAANEAGERGEMISGRRRFQIGAEEERGRLVPRKLRRAVEAELELDLELGRLWRGTGAEGGCYGEWDSKW